MSKSIKVVQKQDEKQDEKKDKIDITDELESLYHLEYLNDMVHQVNNYKLKIITRIFKEFISKEPSNSLDYKSFKNKILKKNREVFNTSKNKDK